MNDFFKKMAEQIKSMWGGLNGGQKASLILLSALLVTAVGWLLAGTRTDDMVLFVGPDESLEMRGQIKQELDKRNFRYEIRNDSIYVQRREQDRIRLEMAGSSLFPDSTLYKFLDEPSLMSTGAHFEKQWLVAVQRRLAKFIMEIDAVRSAGVQITPPSQRAEMNFVGGSPAKAAVQIEMKPGKRLTSKNIKAIAHVVSNSVKGLEPSGVAIMDTQGQLYKLPKDEEDWSASITRIEQEEEREKRIVAKIREALTGFVRDPSDLFIAVTVALNARTSEEKDKIITTPMEVESLERVMKEESTPHGAPSGIVQEGAVDLSKVSAPGSSKTDTMNKIKSVAGEKNSWVKTPPGDIEKSSAAVVMRLIKDDKGAASVADDNTMKEVISKATGIVAANISFSRLEVPLIPPTPIVPSSTETIQDLMNRFGGPALLTVLILVSLFIMYRIMKRSAPPKTIYEEIEQERRKVAMETEGIGLAQASVESEEAKVSGFKKGVKDMVQKNPRGVAGIVRRWATEK